MAKVDSEQLRHFLKQVARQRGPLGNPSGLREVAKTIEQALVEFGYSVRRDPVTFEGVSSSNLIAQRSTPSTRPFIVGAHYDAVEGSPGADDNASGVAVLLESARALADHPAVGSVCFAAFTLEEWGMVGSSRYVASLKRDRIQPIGMVSLEMVGFTHPSQSYPLGLAPFYPKEGNFIGVGANSRSRSLLTRFVRGMRRVPNLPVETITVPGGGGIIPAIRLSDHSPFWDAGIPALLVTDTSFYRNPHYHTAEDAIETLDLPFLERVAQAVVEGIIECGTGDDEDQR